MTSTSGVTSSNAGLQTLRQQRWHLCDSSLTWPNITGCRSDCVDLYWASLSYVERQLDHRGTERANEFLKLIGKWYCHYLTISDWHWEICTTWNPGRIPPTDRLNESAMKDGNIMQYWPLRRCRVQLRRTSEGRLASSKAKGPALGLRSGSLAVRLRALGSGLSHISTSGGNTWGALSFMSVR